ncbi:MAG: chorismate synthase [Chlamydiae bacterium]|nr:chorismate synthase [Chlamydiota bacterium]
MASNSFGTIFRITTWGESHGKAIGVVIDGCPSGLAITDSDINNELSMRAPGRSPYTSPRAEMDSAEILSGVFEGKTTGAPISIIIYNRDADTSKYEPIKDLLRPGHANFTYLEKYGIFDYRGGGRSSARETACRVAAGAVAKKLLSFYNIKACAYIKEIGGITSKDPDFSDIDTLKLQIRQNPIFCPDTPSSEKMMQKITETMQQKDSLGGVVEFVATEIPPGIGDPVYEKLEANLAKAMLSIPASKGFEMGSGFLASTMKGSEHNDQFTLDEQKKVRTLSNHAGGTLGGISTGMPLLCRVAFKPTSSIGKPQSTLSTDKVPKSFALPEGSRHDPCVTIRAVSVVEAMGALVLIDAILLNRVSRI